MRWERSANSSRVLANSRRDLDRETSALSSALRNNKVRGAWGEAQLRNIVESAGLSGTCRFRHPSCGHRRRWTYATAGYDHPHAGRQNHSDRREGAIRRLPAAHARFQTPPHRRNWPARTELLHSHAKAVRDHVKTLGDKAYWNAFSDAPDFVIAFIPNESLLQAALETDPTLMDDAFAQQSRADLADHPMGGAQIRGIRMAAAKPDR